VNNFGNFTTNTFSCFWETATVADVFASAVHIIAAQSAVSSSIFSCNPLDALYMTFDTDVQTFLYGANTFTTTYQTASYMRAKKPM